MTKYVHNYVMNSLSWIPLGILLILVYLRLIKRSSLLEMVELEGSRSHCPAVGGVKGEKFGKLSSFPVYLHSFFIFQNFHAHFEKNNSIFHNIWLPFSRIGINFVTSKNDYFAVYHIGFWLNFKYAIVKFRITIENKLGLSALLKFLTLTV